MPTDDLLRRFARRDPVLLAALFCGNDTAVSAVTRLLRLTPLPILLQHQAALVAVLTAVPEIHGRMQSTWSRQDPKATCQVFGWVEQSRRRLHRGTQISHAQTPESHETVWAVAA